MPTYLPQPVKDLISFLSAPEILARLISQVTYEFPPGRQKIDVFKVVRMKLDSLQIAPLMSGEAL